MNIQTLSFFNVYGLQITQNTDNVFTIKNRAGETFLAEFFDDNTISLRHYNYKAERGGTHRQGNFSSVSAMLRDVYTHGDRLFKPLKKNKIDRLFDQIARR